MLSALYVVVSLIILEGLLSFDNALVLAAMVQPLPEKQQKLALRIGIIGAYVMRGLSIFFVAFLIQNPWLKPVGAAWLLYLMCSNLGKAGGDDDDEEGKKSKPASFWWTVFGLEMADMTFSIDNIFAAAAFSPNIYAVLTGVAIGILAMRFVAGLFVSLIKKFPVLESIGYVLVGYIGATLASEYFFDLHLSETVKFAGVVGIMALGVLYERVGFLNRLLTPVFGICATLMGYIATPIDYVTGKVGEAYHATPLSLRLAALLCAIVGGATAWVYFYGLPFNLAGTFADMSSSWTAAMNRSIVSNFTWVDLSSR
jgi:tellurite resistance protein TerC